MAARGHLAAKKAFLEGKSELGIYYAYLESMRLTEEELPYNAIIALNEKSSILHYFHRRDQVKNANSFLIDAGAQYHGYACDISRTYACESSHEVFKSLIQSMINIQQNLCKEIKLGVMYEEVHINSLHQVSQILIDHKIILDMSVEAIVSEGLINTFYPHGLGHSLGLFVHDVAGHQKNREGEINPRNPLYPTLRSNKLLEAGNCLTIEPGLYFIEMLLNKVRSNKNINWNLVEELKALGGIRIEDNVLVTEDGSRNLTRAHLPD